MKANEINMNRFISQSDTQFIIPVYQRNYDWTQVHCKQLLDDILTIGRDVKKSAHFVGSIVYIHDDIYSASGIRELTIIDGQQRLTTVTLIFLTILQIAKKMGNESLINRINETYLINKYADDTDNRAKLKLRPTENNDEALRYILRNDKNEDFDDYSNLIDNYNYFLSRISEENFQTVLDGLTKLMFVEISLERDKDDPQKIFESLNSTGLDLSQADLIRNYILMGLKRNDQNRIYTDYWKYIESKARDNELENNRVSDFIRDFLTLENKKIPNKNRVYQEFKIKYPILSITKLENNLKKLKKYVNYYAKFLNPDIESDTDIRRQLHLMKRLDVVVHFPFLLKVFNDYEEKVIDKKNLIAILELIQSFVWRRFIINLPTNALNKIFMNLHDDIDEKNYLYSIQYSLIKKKGTQRFPHNTEVTNSLREKDIYGIKPKNRYYFFERLENLNNKEYIEIEENEEITIEHIFPQNPDIMWKKDLDNEDFISMRESYLNTIANLTLSGNNGKLGNKSFLEKKNMNIENKEQGYKYSRLWLNRYLSEIDSWTTIQIKERFKLLNKRFMDIWKYPEIDINENLDYNEINIFDADDPTNKKLEYAIFFDQKILIKNVQALYKRVLTDLFSLNPKIFFNSDLSEILTLTKDPNLCRTPYSLNDTYFIECHLDNRSKFSKIKRALVLLECEDELFIKFKKNET